MKKGKFFLPSSYGKKVLVYLEKGKRFLTFAADYPTIRKPALENF